MRRLLVVGIGSGNPEQITVEAINALRRADVLFFLDKGSVKRDLNALREDICRRYLEKGSYRTVSVRDPVRSPDIADYVERVHAWHAERVEIFERLLRDELTEDGTGAVLVWGDPSLYDSTLRIVEQVLARATFPFEYKVIPGITSVQALAASHRVILHDVGAPLEITTGRRLKNMDPAAVNNTVVMLDGECSFNALANEPDMEIRWGAYLGSDREVIIAGRLQDNASRIVKERDELRAKYGWIMDIYQLHRRSTPVEPNGAH